MESRTIEPFATPPNAVVRLPGSKSLTNRALLIASLAEGKTHLTNALFSDDSKYFAKALMDLGFKIDLDFENHTMDVHGRGGNIPAKNAELFIGNAGTAARFLCAFLTLGDGVYVVDGDARMRERPIGDLVLALSQLGVKIESSSILGQSGICPPIKIFANGLEGGKTNIPGNISSQFLSALLMVAPYANDKLEINVTTELNSKPYVDMTLGVMSDFGVNICREGYCNFVIHPDKYKTPGLYAIEPDASAASYFFAMPAILGGSVCIENLTRKSKQGDVAFVDVLSKMGCVVVENENSIMVSAPKFGEGLTGVDVDMCDIPDTAQTLAAVAPFASTPTRIRGIASARVKETDRVSATCKELSKLGVHVEEYEDGMMIYPCSSFRSCSIGTYNDHRMAMAFSLIGLRVPDIKIENPGCVSKTFPNYFEVLDGLR